jgi:hypothetical protein
VRIFVKLSSSKRENRKLKQSAKNKERERIAALEKARVEWLLNEAQALQRARDIRLYVDEVKALILISIRQCLMKLWLNGRGGFWRRLTELILFDHGSS